MVTSNFLLLHSFFVPILFLEMRQLQRTEPVFIKTRSKPSEQLHKLVSTHVTRRRKKDEDHLDQVNALDDPGQNFIDNVNGYKVEMKIKKFKFYLFSEYKKSFFCRKNDY